MKKSFLFVFILAGLSNVFAQNSVTLTFTCKTSVGSHMLSDSIVIENLSRGWKETLYHPDTVFVLGSVGIPNQCAGDGLQVMPNPFDGTTRVIIQSSNTESVMIMLVDMSGSVCAEYTGTLQKGGNQFSVSLTSPQTYILSVQTPSGNRFLKMQNVGRGGSNRIALEGLSDSSWPVVELKSYSDLPFELGDEMRYLGYASSRASLEVRKVLSKDETISLEFDMHGTSCEGIPTIQDYDGNVYNTVQIGNQCWMKESLRTKHYDDGTEIPTTTNFPGDVPYLYLPDNHIDYVPRFGYLYNWVAVMHGESSSNSIPSGVRGICPEGWHVPSSAEWTSLINYVRSQNQFLCGDNTAYIAKALASNNKWYESTYVCSPGYNQEANNSTGFTGYPAGGYYGTYFYTGDCVSFWSSTENMGNYVYGISYSYIWEDVNIGNIVRAYGYSVRCLRD